MRALCMAFDMAQSRVQSYVANRSRALAAVSHDLKTPLTRMRLRVETLSDDGGRERSSSAISMRFPAWFARPSSC